MWWNRCSKLKWYKSRDLTRIKIIVRLWNAWADIDEIQGLILHTQSSIISLRQ
jgi:hypothetical protein